MKITKKVNKKVSMVAIHNSIPESLKDAIAQKVAKETIVRKKRITANQWVTEVLEKAVQ